MLCLAQVATVNALGLTDPERIWWALISGNALLLSKTVGDFFDREDALARRDLLLEASARGDGTYDITPGQAKVLADALFARLRQGVWARGEGGPLFVDRGLSEPFLAAPLQCSSGYPLDRLEHALLSVLLRALCALPVL